MKKVILVLVIAMLAACGGSASVETKGDSTVKDTLAHSTIVADSTIIDSLKK